MLSPDGVQGAQAARGLDVANHTDHHDGRALDDGHRLAGLLLVQLGPGLLNLTHNVGHAYASAHTQTHESEPLTGPAAVAAVVVLVEPYWHGTQRASQPTLHTHQPCSPQRRSGGMAWWGRPWGTTLPCPFHACSASWGRSPGSHCGGLRGGRQICEAAAQAAAHRACSEQPLLHLRSNFL